LAETMKDEVKIITSKAITEGWESIRITRGIERCPNDFTLTMSERYKGELQGVSLFAGDEFELTIENKKGKNEPVITGFIDRYVPSINKSAHSISVSGRGKCQDLVDCSAIYENGAFVNMTLPSIASALLTPFSVDLVVTKAAQAYITKVIPSFPLMYGETVIEIIERIAQYVRVLVYEDNFGRLALDTVSTTRIKSGIQEGKNVQAANIVYANDQRFKDYYGYYTAIDNYNDVSGHATALQTVKPVSDGGITRYRPKIFIMESGDVQANTLQARLSWECNRRAGRGQALRVQVDSWRDGEDNLWEPNTIVPVHIPTLKINHKDMLIGEVTYIRNGQQGTIAELVLMPPEAYAPQPIVFIKSNLPELAKP